MFLEDFVTAIEARSLARPLPSAPREVVLPAADEPLDEKAQYLGDAEGQSFMIEYVDSTGRQSARRITVYGLALGRAGVPLLTAKCHERNATRQFRVDRIRCCIDYGGEVHDDVSAFLFDNFGMSAGLAKRKAADDSQARWRDIIELVRDDAVLLAAMSQSDGAVHRDEVDAATRHLAHLAEAQGTLISDADALALSAHFVRLRPTADAIRRALERLSRQDVPRIQRLLLSAVQVLDADGQRHPAEMRLLSDMCLELTGVALST